MKINWFYVLYSVLFFMFCSDTLTVQSLGLRTSPCHFHHSLSFLPPRDTHTIVSMDGCPVATIHIPDHIVWAQTPGPDIPSGLQLSSQDSSHFWQLHPEINHNLTGSAWIWVFDYFIAKGKGHKKLDLSKNTKNWTCLSAFHWVYVHMASGSPKGPCIKHVPVLPQSQARALQRYYVLLISFFCR